MKKQKVVRTYPNNYTNPITTLVNALAEGWIVVMCNQTYLENNRTCLEYILEKTFQKISIPGREGGTMYENGMSCVNCQNCKTRGVTDGNGNIIREEHHCIIDGCEVDDYMLCGNYE